MVLGLKGAGKGLNETDGSSKISLSLNENLLAHLDLLPGVTSRFKDREWYRLK